MQAPTTRSARIRRALMIVAILPLTGFAGLSIASCSAPELGLRDGRLLPLSGSPNGVSSLATDESQRVAPLRLPGIDGGITAARAALERLVLEMPRTELLVGEEEYLRFVCTSLVWRFRDDLEFHVVPEEMVIHVRSASRVGYSDLGANRARVKRFRRVWGDWLARHGSGR